MTFISPRDDFHLGVWSFTCKCLHHLEQKCVRPRTISQSIGYYTKRLLACSGIVERATACESHLRVSFSREKMGNYFGVHACSYMTILERKERLIGISETDRSLGCFRQSVVETGMPLVFLFPHFARVPHNMGHDHGTTPVLNSCCAHT